MSDAAFLTLVVVGVILCGLLGIDHGTAYLRSRRRSLHEDVFTEERHARLLDFQRKGFPMDELRRRELARVMKASQGGR